MKLALAFVGAAALFGADYQTRFTKGSKASLLRADNAVWEPAQTIRWGASPFETRFRSLWSTRGLWVRFDSDDNNPWHTMTNRDDHLWDEEVVEVFLDLDNSGKDYAEIEINPANVICDVRMRSAGPKKVSDLEWNHRGIETKVMPFDGGWTAVAFLPWDGFRSLPAGAKAKFPPTDGTTWRFNVFRIERPNGPADPKTGAIFNAWSNPGGPSFHVPAAFRPFVFVR